ncbi:MULTISPECIES: GNAT family N-acetyltransferase [Calothrix]|uniref:N-acetyltransferase n=2 Tax=Calothrix TaxID=1186 RepID=A0ABR8ADI3_9CYAN|nr:MULTISPECIES: GNAT family N-acetyltransferase [Calothrix]MBD2197809.1 N-acetyltransferase [Calothrix parietina FACHB-288]MBD2226213.1 N-acetyltransferase [Calothrix anomala FACHB-343]
MNYVSFRILQYSDAEKLSDILLKSDKSYIKYFHPFDFQVATIQKILFKSCKDKFFGVVLESGLSQESDLIGFYMLRGLDEGYTDPMFGVFISQQYSSKGIGRITITHAESFCKFCGYEKLLLKVNPENTRARKMYESLGFRYLREEGLLKNLVLYKNIYIN